MKNTQQITARIAALTHTPATSAQMRILAQSIGACEKVVTQRMNTRTKLVNRAVTKPARELGHKMLSTYEWILS